MLFEIESTDMWVGKKVQGKGGKERKTGAQPFCGESGRWRHWIWASSACHHLGC